MCIRDRCNALARLFAGYGGPKNGVIVHSDLLLRYLQAEYPGLYFVSSTTKVLTAFPSLRQELDRAAFRYVVDVYKRQLLRLLHRPEHL